MIGAIIGDIVGAPYEFANKRSKNFNLFENYCMFTDDTVMTLAVAQALAMPHTNIDELSQNTVKCMQALGEKYPHCGYGFKFSQWLTAKNPQPYNSFGNGAAMRVSPVGWVANSVEEANALSAAVTKITHNHPEGLKGAEAVAVAIVLARQGKSKEEIRRYITENYYTIDFTLDEIRSTYQFNETCQGSVPQAFEAFFESVDFEDCIRNAVSIGGDSDTIAAIAGSIAEAYYGVPKWMEQTAMLYLPDELKKIYRACENLNKINN